MVKLKIGRKAKRADGAAPSADGAGPSADAAPTVVDAPTAVDVVEAPAAVDVVDAPAPEASPAAVAVDDTPPAAAEWEPPPAGSGTGGGSSSASAGGVGGLFNRMYGDVGEQTAAERERQAALEFQQAMAPALELLHASVPEASSPEEAARILDERQGATELVPDPKGGAYVNGDAYDTDARIYYRLLRRDYEKTPRPSEKRATSHHLHQVYGKLTGNKGW